MAYQPVERDAGRIMYEAALRRGQTIGGAITDWTNTLYQRQEENKQFDAKVKALEQVYKQNAPQFGFKTPEELTQFLSQDMNQTPKERYARLATFLEDKIVASREQRTQQLQEAQVADLTQQAAVNKQRAAEMQRESEFWSAIEARRQEQAKAAGRLGPTDVEGVTRGITEPRAGAVSQFLTPLPRATADQGVPSGVPVMLGGVAAAQPKPSVAAGMPVAPSQRSIAYTAEDVDEAAMRSPAGSKRSDVIKLAMQIAKDRAATAMPQQGIYLTQAETLEAKGKLPATPGMMWVDEYVPQAKGWVLKQVPAPETPEMAAQRALDVELGKQQASEASAMITKSKTQAEAARLDTPRLDRIQKALEQGVKTGFAAEEISALTSALVELGFYPEGKQATKDVLFADLAQDALQKAQQFYQSQGAVSEAERKRIDKLAMDAKKQPAALLELLKTTRALYERQIAADSHRMTLEDKFGDAPRARLSVAKGLDRWYSQNPLSKFGVTQPKAAPGSSQGKLESLLSEFPETKSP